MRALNLIIMLFPIISNFSLYCQQDGQNCDLKTVYKTLRTPGFNQAWESHKNSYSKSNPYDQLIDRLYEQNSSVATYVKDITKNMRADMMSPAEKQLFDKHKELQKEEIDLLIKTNNNQPSAITASSDLEDLSTDIIDVAQRLKFPFSLNIDLQEKNKSFSDCVLANNSFLLLGTRIEATLNLYLKDFDTLHARTYWGLPIKKESQNKLILGCLLHELAHLHYLHPIEDQRIFTRLSRKHVQEYEADWYWARKNKYYASLLENLSRKQNIFLNISSCESHPATKDRYKNLKEIRRLKEAESRWIWGPKGYEKYGDPAYEKAFINWSEKQK